MDTIIKELGANANTISSVTLVDASAGMLFALFLSIIFTQI